MSSFVRRKVRETCRHTLHDAAATLVNKNSQKGQASCHFIRKNRNQTQNRMALRASMNNSIRLLRGALGVSSFPSAAYTSPNSWRQLSTSVAAVETPKKTGRRRIIDTKDPIVLTERAADRIKEILSNKHENGESAVGIRIGTKRRGCNGLSYTMNYAFENRRKILKWKPTGLKSILNRWRYSI